MPTLKAPEFAPEVNPQVQTTRKKVAHVSQPEDRHVTKSVSRDDPFLLDGDFLLVENHSVPHDRRVRREGKNVTEHVPAETYVFRWAKKAYVVEPGETKHVIFEALVDALGDPRSMDNEVIAFNDGNGSVGIVMKRFDELSRLFARYAVENENIDELVTRTPEVAVTTLDGQRVIFPGNRPDMLPFPVTQIDEKNLNVDQTKMYDRLAAENAEFREQIRLTNERMDTLLAEREGVEAGG